MVRFILQKQQNSDDAITSTLHIYTTVESDQSAGYITNNGVTPSLQHINIPILQ
jgi:hypothetical protein